jgi:ipoprotein LpqH
VKREFLVAVAGASMVVAGLAGCSSNKSSTTSASSSAASSASSSASSPSSASSASTSAAAAAPGPGQAKVTIDGQDQDTTGGQIVCTTSGDTTTLVIQAHAGQYSAQVNAGNPPTVSTVSLQYGTGEIAYKSGTGMGSAQATQDGNSYKVTGTATGVDTANPTGGMVSKPFEIDLTCPTS